MNQNTIKSLNEKQENAILHKKQKKEHIDILFFIGYIHTHTHTESNYMNKQLFSTI
jgi:hypothetical protein